LQDVEEITEGDALLSPLAIRPTMWLLRVSIKVSERKFPEKILVATRTRKMNFNRVKRLTRKLTREFKCPTKKISVNEEKKFTFR